MNSTQTTQQIDSNIGHIYVLFSLKLSSVSLKIYILSNPGSVVKFNQLVYNVNEDEELVQPKLILSNPSSTEITVQVNDNSVTATGELERIKLKLHSYISGVSGGDDYNSGPYIVQFPAGVTSASFNVSITKDNVSEGNENFNLMINSSMLPNGVTVDATGNTMIIVNDRSSESFCNVLYLYHP